MIQVDWQVEITDLNDLPLFFSLKDYWGLPKSHTFTELSLSLKVSDRILPLSSPSVVGCITLVASWCTACHFKQLGCSSASLPLAILESTLGLESP